MIKFTYILLIKGGFTVLRKVLYVDRRALSVVESLFIALACADYRLTLLPGSADGQTRRGMGFVLKIISGITFPGLTLHLIYFVRRLLFTLRTNQTPNTI